MRHVSSGKLADEMAATNAPFARSFVDSKANNQLVGGKSISNMTVSIYNDLQNAT